jgi:hypothetical protein
MELGILSLGVVVLRAMLADFGTLVYSVWSKIVFEGDRPVSMSSGFRLSGGQSSDTRRKSSGEDWVRRWTLQNLQKDTGRST